MTLDSNGPICVGIIIVVLGIALAVRSFVPAMPLAPWGFIGAAALWYFGVRFVKAE